MAVLRNEGKGAGASPEPFRRSPPKNPVNSTKGKEKILRGGAFQLDPPFLRTYHRYWLSDLDRISDIGFRTVVNGASEEPKK